MNPMNKAALLTALMLTTPYCMAAPYFGLGLGKSSTEALTPNDVMTLETGFNGGEVLDSFSQKNTDTAFKFFAGYSLNKNLNLETGYINFGKYSFVTNDTDNRYDPSATSFKHHVESEIKTSGLYISATPQINYSNGISINPTLGILIWSTTGKLRTSTDATYASKPDFHVSSEKTLSDNGVDPIIGLGVSYDRYSIEYERTKFDQSNINLIMLSVKI